METYRLYWDKDSDPANPGWVLRGPDDLGEDAIGIQMDGPADDPGIAIRDAFRHLGVRRCAFEPDEGPPDKGYIVYPDLSLIELARMKEE